MRYGTYDIQSYRLFKKLSFVNVKVLPTCTHFHIMVGLPRMQLATSDSNFSATKQQAKIISANLMCNIAGQTK